MPRLRLQFSLRSLLIVVAVLATALAAGLAWYQRIQVREQMTEGGRWEHYRRGTVCDGHTLTTVEPPTFREVYEFYHDLDGREIRHGQATTYDLEGHKLREDNWRRGRLHGPWTEWHPDGSKLGEGEYRHGQPHGTWVSHLPPGLWRAQHIQDLQKDIDQFGTTDFGGESRPRLEIIVEEFEAGHLTHVTGWDQSRAAMLCEAHFVGGQPDGEVLWRSQDGAIIGRWRYQNGQLNGPCQTWHMNGTRACVGAFSDGKQDGRWEGWYEDGTKGELGSYLAGQWHGSWTWWNRDGTLDCQAEYEHGRALSLRFPQLPSIPIQGAMTEHASRRILSEAAKQTHCEFNETPFKDVVSYLAEFHGFPILLNHRAIDKSGISEAPIAYNPRSADGHASDVTLQAALQHVLKPLGVVPVVRHEILLITTPKDADEWRDRSGVPQLFKSTQAQLVQELQKPTWIEFNETSLKDVCRYFSELHGIKLSVDPTLGEEDQALEITAALKGVTLAAALEFLCDQYGLMCTGTGTEVLVGRAATDAAGERRGVSPPWKSAKNRRTFHGGLTPRRSPAGSLLAG